MSTTVSKILTCFLIQWYLLKILIYYVCAADVFLENFLLPCYGSVIKLTCYEHLS